MPPSRGGPRVLTLAGGYPVIVPVTTFTEASTGELKIRPQLRLGETGPVLSIRTVSQPGAGLVTVETVVVEAGSAFVPVFEDLSNRPDDSLDSPAQTRPRTFAEGERLTWLRVGPHRRDKGQVYGLRLMTQ